MLVAAASGVWGAFPGTDVFLPSVGRAQGVSSWYTELWVHNPGSSPVIAQFFFLLRDQVNSGALPVSVTIQGGDTVHYANALGDLFGTQGFGAIRVLSDQKLLVTSRVYSKASAETVKDSKGQDFAGIPATLAIALGQTTELLGATQTLPTATPDQRYNFGFVETSGNTCTVKVTPLDTTGAALASAKTYTVRALEQKQYQMKNEFPSVSTDNARLQVEVATGSGKVIAFGSCITNSSQDPTTFEMAFRDDLLGAATGLTAVSHDTSLTGDGLTLPYSGSPATAANNDALRVQNTGAGMSSSGVGVSGVTSSTNAQVAAVNARNAGAGIGLYAEAGTGKVAAILRGNVRLLSYDSGATVRELGEGLDYAEGFDVSGERTIEPGSVLVIDRADPGKLALSTKAYDRRVAGIAAGADGLGSGVRLGAGTHDLDVALAGRVYCNVDASESAVDPGDLLTTSSTPGQAMKAIDLGRSHGAILGKAMQPLPKGQRGRILAPVAFQ